MAATAILSRLFSVLFFRLCLDAAYILYVSPAFLNDPITPMPLDEDIPRYVISLFFAVIPVTFMSFAKKDLSGIFMFSAMVFLYVPMTSMYGFNTEIPIEGVLITLLALFTSSLFLRIPAFPLPASSKERSGSNEKREMTAVRVSIFFIILFIAWSIYSGAIFDLNIDLSKIYYFREENSKILDYGIWAYLNLWAQKIFCPFLFAFFIFKRRYIPASITILASFYFFAVTQHRIHLFTPVLVVVAYLFYSCPISLARIYFLSGLAVLAIVAAALVLDLDILASLTIRRALYVGASVAFDWIEYFSTVPKIWWTDRYLLGRPPTVYTGVNIPEMMAQIKHPGTPWAFNSGMVGTGYSQAGVFGVVLYSALLGIFINYANRLVREGRPAFIAAAILIGPIRTAWADSDLLTTLLSHGIIVALIVLSMLGTTDAASARRFSSGAGIASQAKAG